MPASGIFFFLPSPSKIRLILFLFAVSSLLPVALRAQASFTGAAASGNFGAQAIGSASAAKTLPFSIASGTHVGSIAVVTTGVANLDFANTAASTCKAQTYLTTSACVVDVTFTPLAAGLRKGAVVFFSGANNKGTVLGSAPIYGVGSGPQIAFGSSVASTVDRTMHNQVGLSNPISVALDAAGSLFVLDDQTNPSSYRLVTIPAGGGAPISSQPSANGEALYLPSCIAVDGAGNLYIGDFFGRVVMIPAGGGAATAIDPVVNHIALNYPSGLAVDGAGNLFIADFVNNRVLELSAGGGASISIAPVVDGLPLNDPHGLAIDAAGNLFIADLGNDRIVEVPAGGGTPAAIVPTSDGQGLGNPKEVAVDGAGDLFIADNINHRVVEVPAGTGPATSIAPAIYFSGMGDVFGVAVDGGGNLFMVQGGLQAGSNVVEEMQYAQAPVLTFSAPTNIGSTDTADGPQTVEIANIGNQPLSLTTLHFPADFSEVSAEENSCTGSTTLAPGQQCNLSIAFTPQNTGSLSESISLANNSLRATQSISLKGVAESEAVITSPAPGTVLMGSSVAFTWTAGVAATGYYLSIGSTGPGSTDVFNSGKRTVTSWTATGLPTNGKAVYVRLTTYFNNILMHEDYIYTTQTSAVLTSPVPGQALTGSGVTFTWTSAAGAVSYNLWLGSTGTGSYNLFASPSTTGTSVSVSGLPTNGETIYARLYTKYNGETVHTDYTYIASAQSALTSPSQSSHPSNRTSPLRSAIRETVQATER